MKNAEELIKKRIQHLTKVSESAYKIYMNVENFQSHRLMAQGMKEQANFAIKELSELLKEIENI